MANSIKLELEDFISGWGFGISEGHSFASGGGVAFLMPGQLGAGATYFTGPSGRYDVKIHYFDENDGVSRVMLDVAGDSKYFNMDAASPWSFPGAATAASRTTHTSIEIDTGAVVTVSAQAQGQEYAAIDYIEFIPVEPEPPAPTPVPAPQPSTPTAPPAPAEDTPETLDAFEQQVLELTNAKRAQAGLQPLVFNSALSAAADKHSKDMADKNQPHAA